NTYIGLILAYAGFALPFTVFFLYAFFRQLPEEIAESASIDGAGDFRTFFQVMAPMAAPGLASVTIFNFLGLWNQFLLPVVLNTDDSKFVLAQGLMNLQAQQGYQADWGAMFASVTITIAPVVLVYVIVHRQLHGRSGPSPDQRGPRQPPARPAPGRRRATGAGAPGHPGIPGHPRRSHRCRRE